MTATHFAFALEDDGDDCIRRYPNDKPFVQRDQSARAGDDTTRVVIGDIADVLMEMANEYKALADKAQKLYDEVDTLPWDDNGNWIDVEQDPDGPEKLRDILEEAEQLDHVYVDWNGDSGTVTTSISDCWYEVEEQ